MSKSATIFPSSKTDLPKQITINLIEVDQIIQFAADTQGIHLSVTQQADIKNALTTHESLSNLNEMIIQFIDINNNLNALPGLNNKQMHKLKELMSIRKKFKETYTDKEGVDLQQFESFIENEKSITPFNQAVQWWLVNTQSLRKQKVWDGISKQTVVLSNERGATEKDISNKLKELDTLKNEWNKHQLFSGLSSEDLLYFYKNYVIVLATCINNEIKAKRKYPAIIHDYLKNIATQLDDIKRQIIHSMLQRLKCAEFYVDIFCDDLLAYICDKIDSKSNMEIQKNLVKPKLRHSLTADLINEFITTISSYCENNPNEKEIASGFSDLSMCSAPKSWITENSSKTKILIKNHVITFFAFAFPNLMLKVTAQQDLAINILNTRNIEEKSFILNHLSHLIEVCTNEHVHLLSKKPFELNNSISKFITDSEKQYHTLLNELNVRINYEIQNKLNEIIDDIFANKAVDFNKVNNIVFQINNARMFNQKYLNNNYFATGDFILFLANRIANLINTNHQITKSHCENLLKLMRAFHSQINSEQIKQLYTLFENLPTVIDKLKDVTGSLQLHYLINHLETPFLRGHQLSTPLERHKQIALTYDEKWESFKIGNNSTDNKINIIIAYLKNVSLKLVKIATNIDLDNFDHTQGCTLCVELKNYIDIDNISVEQKAEATSIRKNYEIAILEKINNSLEIKNYLFDDTSKQVNLEKLSTLLKRIKQFFTDEPSKKAMLDSLIKACSALLKAYVLDAVEKEYTPNFDYMCQLNQLLEANIVCNLCHDESVKKTLKAYISTYDGTKTHLSQVLTGLNPDDNECEKLLVSYAKKRLDYIHTSQDITTEDYYFFAHFSLYQTEIADLFAAAKKSAHNNIQSLVVNMNALWDAKQARYLELFGDKNEIMVYRLKRVLEMMNIEHPKDDNKTNVMFAELMATINNTYLFDHRIIDNHVIITNNISLHDYLNDAIQKRDWSLLLEYVIKQCGTLNQRQQLHTNLSLRYLDRIADFRQSWLDKQIKHNVDLNAPDNDYSAAMNQDLSQLFFIEFLGESNTQKILEKIEPLLKELIIAGKSNAVELAKNEYERLVKIALCLTPLKSFYLSFSKDEESKEFFQHIEEFGKKLKLRHELFSIVKKHSILFDVINDDVSLQNLLSAFKDAMNEFNNNGTLCENNIDHFIEFCNLELLTKIESALNSSNSKLSFTTLQTLVNFSADLTSNSFKQHILNAHIVHIENNPHWLSLINHIDDKETLEKLSSVTADDPAQAFSHFLQYGKRLHHIQHLTKHLLKDTMLADAKIKIKNDESILARLHSDTTSSKRLIKLWMICATKLQDDALKSASQLCFLTFVLKFLTQITDEILRRSEHKPSILLTFIPNLDLLINIKSNITSIDNSKSKLSPRSLWANASAIDVAMQPLLRLRNKAITMRSMYITEDYLSRKLNKDKMKQFKSACNDPVFTDEKKIKSELDIKNKFDIKKIRNAQKLYQKLKDIMANNASMLSMIPLLQEMIDDASKHPELAKAKTYNTFLREMQMLFTKNSVVMNDKEYSIPTNKKIQSSQESSTIRRH